MLTCGCCDRRKPLVTGQGFSPRGEAVSPRVFGTGGGLMWGTAEGGRESVV